MSGHAVLSALKLNLKWGSLKIEILTPSGTQTAPNLRSFFDANLMEFEDDWDKQCTEINVLFPKYFMLFQQFCFRVVGEYGWREAHLCMRATTFYALPVPLPRQVHVELFFPDRKTVLKKLFQRVPKWILKVDKIDKKRVQEGSRKGTSKRYPLQDQEK